jgi:type I restriction enzyme S subunit
MKVKLSDIAEFKNGINFSKSDKGNFIKCIGVGDFGGICIVDNFDNTSLICVDKEISDEYFLKDNDIIFVRSNGNKELVGRSMIVFPKNENVVCSGFCIRMRITTSNVLPLYIYFLMNSPIYRLQFAKTQQTNINNLNQTILGDLIINIPSIDVQKRIVSTLMAVDKKIGNNNKINDNLHQQVRLLYNYWFTQFDFPDENGNPYRSSGGTMVWNEKLCREIPAGWSSESMINSPLSTIIRPGVEVFDNKTYLATADVNGTFISTGSIVEYASRESRANMQPTINSVWFAKMKNSIKHLFLNKEMLWIINSSILSTGFCGLQCKDKSFEYISSFIEYSYFETIKDTIAHGATQEAVNNDDLDGIFMVIPDDKTILRYHEVTKGIYAKISKNMCENRELTNLRDWLLPMLMNGQVTVE